MHTVAICLHWESIPGGKRTLGEPSRASGGRALGEAWEIRKILAKAIPERAFSPLDGMPQGSEDRRSKESEDITKAK